MRKTNRTVWVVIAVIVGLCLLASLCAVGAAFLFLDDVRREVEGPGGPDPDVTEWPRPVCTPPACRDDEVYYCPGDCPGGCGTECATPTPAP